MKLFNNRRDETYISELRRRIEVDGEDGLISTAISIGDKEKYDNKFDQQVRIDFFGIAATNILREDNREHNAYNEFKSLLLRLKELNEKRIRVKIRFLFLYPYSNFAHSLIEAETVSNRSAINQAKHRTDYLKVVPINEHDFTYSSILENQVKSLKTIQILIERINEATPDQAFKIYPGSANQILIRFTPLPLSFCGLIINKACFFDSYQYSKINRDDSRLAYNAPLLRLEKTTKGDERKLFCCVSDHFRYLWRHPLTMDVEDATYFKYSDGADRHSMSLIKDTFSANFFNKGIRIKKRIIHENNEPLSEEQIAILDREITRYRMTANNLLEKHCITTTLGQASENLFITCSWYGQDDHIWTPNEDAKFVQDWLETDFQSTGDKSLLNIDLFIGKVGQNFADSLYEQLKRTTLSLVILSADIVDEKTQRKYARPNMYHELGFMMSNLPENRIHILPEEGLSNVSNTTYMIHGGNYLKNKICLNYSGIVTWLLDNTLAVDYRIATSALENHKDRLVEYEEMKIIDEKECKQATERIDEIIKTINSNSPINQKK